MNSNKAEKLFILMKRYGVNHFKTLEIEIRMDGGPATPEVPIIPISPEVKAPAPQSAPAVDSKIVHHVNEVASLLKLNDYDLVDKLFPDYSQAPPKDGE